MTINRNNNIHKKVLLCATKMTSSAPISYSMQQMMPIVTTVHSQEQKTNVHLYTCIRPLN